LAPYLHFNKLYIYFNKLYPIFFCTLFVTKWKRLPWEVWYAKLNSSTTSKQGWHHCFKSVKEIQQLHGLWCSKEDNFYSCWVNILQCYKYVGALLFTMLVSGLGSNPLIFMSQWKLLVCMCLVALNDYWLISGNHMVLVCRKIYLKFIKSIRWNCCKNWKKIPNCTKKNLPPFF
jgi:hypothetical protein